MQDSRLLRINQVDCKRLKDTVKAATSEAAENDEALLKQDQFKNRTSKVRGLNMDAEVKLPIVFHEREIMENILNNVVTIVCGETGSGKST